LGFRNQESDLAIPAHGTAMRFERRRARIGGGLDAPNAPPSSRVTDSLAGINAREDVTKVAPGASEHIRKSLQI
jgi:hypothetical protein